MKERGDNGVIYKLDLSNRSGKFFFKELMRKPYVQKNSDEKEKPSVNPAEAGGPIIIRILQ